MSTTSLHFNARTTVRVRREIQGAPASISNRQLALKFGLSKTTVGRWRKRTFATDASHAPKRNGFQKLTAAQVKLVARVKKKSGLPLDELREVLRSHYGLLVSRAHLSRLLARHQLTTHSRPKPKASKPGKFKTYPPGFFHVDTTYLPQLDGRRSKAFCAIERSTRWAYLEVVPRKTAQAAAGFLRRLAQKSPITPHTCLSDNGTEYTNRLHWRRSQKNHLFDLACQQHAIRHKCTKIKSPWTNGMIERFNRKLKDSTIHRTTYRCHQHMADDLSAFLHHHNLKPSKLLNGLSPSQAAASYLATTR
jgi:transposase InsO family protein